MGRSRKARPCPPLPLSRARILSRLAILHELLGYLDKVANPEPISQDDVKLAYDIVKLASTIYLVIKEGVSRETHEGQWRE